MTAMLALAVLLLQCGGLSAGCHSLRYLYTAMTPIPGLPKFQIVGFVDDVQIIHYDSDRMEMIPRQRWMADRRGPDFWKKQTEMAKNWQRSTFICFQNAISLSNQTGAINTLQRISACEICDGETTRVLEEYAWNGKDYFKFDTDHLHWVRRLLLPWTETIKRQCDRDKVYNQLRRQFLEMECKELLLKHLEIGETELKAGFYPRSINVTLLRNGHPIQYNISSGVVPNHDGTYQIRTWAEIDLEEKSTYSCQYEHSSKEGADRRDWDGTFRGPPGCSGKRNPSFKIIMLVLAALFAIALIGTAWRCRGEGKIGFSPVKAIELEETSSSSSM
ncbi:major histocompatibility complex class I-related gene protein-like isoform X2 [Stegostoma tigrinum]|uniref:major histocompatibility complex class I-related gene protein-like isoform X2 n=1 Tax=Stegostoma tigrinum TaxID=3053191 RepID=UPI00202AD66C|nr:major histocompatibility complex class I-related gene protein-like isoform X2 [Stegostoma tigrinum]